MGTLTLKNCMILVQCSRGAMAATSLDGKWQVYRKTSVSIRKHLCVREYIFFNRKAKETVWNELFFKLSSKYESTLNIHWQPDFYEHLSNCAYQSQFFREFMDENLTISNSAAGVLAHLVADDPESWTVEKPSRETVKNRLRDTVNNWDLESRRNVRYRYRFKTIPY